MSRRTFLLFNASPEDIVKALFWGHVRKEANLLDECLQDEVFER
jgi:hypothetical protein